MVAGAVLFAAVVLTAIALYDVANDAQKIRNQTDNDDDEMNKPMIGPPDAKFKALGDKEECVYQGGIDGVKAALSAPGASVSPPFGNATTEGETPEAVESAQNLIDAATTLGPEVAPNGDKTNNDNSNE